VVLVGDRGMLTEARIREDLEPVEGLDWITAFIYFNYILQKQSV
jgi:hypothetical protein